MESESDPFQSHSEISTEMGTELIPGLNACYSCKQYFPTEDMRLLQEPNLVSLARSGEPVYFCKDCSRIHRYPAVPLRRVAQFINPKRRVFVGLSGILGLVILLVLTVYIAYGSLIALLYMLLTVPLVPVRLIKDLISLRNGSLDASERPFIQLFINPSLFGETIEENHTLWWNGKIPVDRFDSRLTVTLKNIAAVLLSLYIIIRPFLAASFRTWSLSHLHGVVLFILAVLIWVLLVYWLRTVVVERFFFIFLEVIYLYIVTLLRPFGVLPGTEFELREYFDSIPDQQVPESHRSSCLFCKEDTPLMISAEWVQCPHCRTPAHRDELFKWIEKWGTCPVCTMICFPEKMSH